MQLPITVSALFVAAASASSHLMSRQVGGILICQGANATGTCEHNVYSLEKCHDLPKKLIENASTFAPDGDGFYCYPRAGTCDEICTSPTGCTFGAVDFYNPVKFNLASIQWNHLIGSFDCYLNKTTSA